MQKKCCLDDVLKLDMGTEEGEGWDKVRKCKDFCKTCFGWWGYAPLGAVNNHLSVQIFIYLDLNWNVED